MRPRTFATVLRETKEEQSATNRVVDHGRALTATHRWRFRAGRFACSVSGVCRAARCMAYAQRVGGGSHVAYAWFGLLHGPHAEPALYDLFTFLVDRLNPQASRPRP